MKIMAVDFGDARTGLAMCDRTEYLASPVGVLEEKNFLKTVQLTINFAQDMGAGLIVVGYPRNMDGSAGPRAQKCADFAAHLETLCSIPVVLYDERCTTVRAHDILSQNNVRGKQRKEQVDAVAATLILEDYLAWRANHPGETDPRHAK